MINPLKQPENKVIMLEPYLQVQTSCIVLIPEICLIWWKNLVAVVG